MTSPDRMSPALTPDVVRAIVRDELAGLTSRAMRPDGPRVQDPDRDDSDGGSPPG